MTVWEDALESAVNDQMTNPEFCTTYCKVLLEMRTGKFDKREMECVSQKFISKYDIYDAYAFAQIHSMIWSGELVIVEVELGTGPYSDKSIEYNNGVMKKLMKPFSGYFVGGTKDQDGSVKWSEPVFGTEFFLDDDDNEHRRLVSIPPGSVPLEVGYTSAARTFGHLNLERGIARWPYGYDEMLIMVRVKGKSLKSVPEHEINNMVKTKRMA